MEASTTTTVSTTGEMEVEELRLLLRPTERYAHGFKYCKGCSQWVRPGDEVYYYYNRHFENDNNKDKDKKQEVARCPTCKRKLKTKPRSLKSKERLAKLLGNRVKRY